MTVTFPSKSGKDAIVPVSNIIVPDGVIGEGGPLDKYDPSLESPHTTIVGNNIALLKLANDILIDDSKKKIILKI